MTVVRMLPVLVLACALATIGKARAGTINVPDDRPTIGEAVASAAAGDTIRIRPGTYRESVRVTGSARAGLVIEGAGERAVLAPPAGADGIRIAGVPRVTLRRLVVAGGAIGVHVLDSSETVVSDVRVVGSGEGVRIRRCIGCEVVETAVDLTTRGPGIRLRDSSGATVSRSVVRGSHRDGIAIVRSDSLSLGDNRVERSGADGIRLARCDRMQELEGNVAIDNRGSGLRLDCGFVDRTCPACAVEQNTAQDNGHYGMRVRRWARVSRPRDLTAFDNAAAGNRKADFHVRP